jgi:Protein of unknown function (DUF1036)
MKHVIVLAVLAIAIAAFGYPAKADLTVCNKTSQGQLDVAVAYHYTSGSNSYSRSEGYWNIPQGACRNTLALTGYEKVYVFAWAAADRSKMWSGGNGSGHESGAKQFCLDPTGGAFTYKGDYAVAPCDAPSEMRIFRYAGTADQDGDYTYSFGD